MAVLTAIRPRRAPGMVRLVRDDGPWLTVSVDLVAALGLRAGADLGPDRIRAIEDAAADEDAWLRVVRLVALRPRTERELARALRARRVDPARIAATVGRARERGLVDHEGVARIVARRAVARGDAPGHVALRLAAAGVAPGAAGDALREHASDEACLRAAAAHVARRVGPPGSLDAAGHARATRLLAARGHGASAVDEILGPPPRPAAPDLDAVVSEARRRYPDLDRDPSARRRAVAWCARRGAAPTDVLHRLGIGDG